MNAPMNVVEMREVPRKPPRAKPTVPAAAREGRKAASGLTHKRYKHSAGALSLLGGVADVGMIATEVPVIDGR
jgi:hypothetical protein